MSDFWTAVGDRHGLITTAEGTKHFGHSGFRRRVRNGQFEPVHRGVWRVAGSPKTDHQRVLALSLALRAPVGFRTTLSLCGVPGQTLTRPEFVRKGTAYPSRDLTRDLGDEARIVWHRTTFLPEHHLTVIDGIASTTLARALCDVSAVMSLERLPKVVDNCKRMGLITYDDLATCREELRARGRRRTTYLDDVLAARIDGWVVGESPPEDVIRGWLDDAGYAPVAQHWVVANGRRRRLDIALPDDRVAVEYQGIAGRLTPTTVENDSEKITDLQLAGWLVVLVTRKTTRAVFLRSVSEAIERQRIRRP